MASISNIGEENQASKAMKLMTKAMNRSILVFKNFDKQVNRSTSLTKSLMETNQQVMTINASLNQVVSVVDSTVTVIEDLEQKLNGLSEKAYSIYSQAIKTKSAGNNSGSIQYNVVPLVREIFSKTASLGQNTPVAATTPASAISLNTGKETIDQLLKLGTSFKKEPVKTIVDVSLRNAVEEQQIKSILINRVDSTSEGSALFDSLKSQALQTGTALGDVAKGALILAGATKNSDQLSKLSEFSLQLATLDPSGKGSEASGRAVMSAVKGDSSLLSKQYDISQSTIQAFNLEGLGKSGDIDGFTTALGQALEQANMGKEAMEQMMATPVKQAQVLEQNINSAFAGLGTDPLLALLEPLKLLNNFFQAGVFQPFFDSLGQAITLAANLFSWLATVALWIALIISVLWPFIEPVIWGIVAALTAWFLINGAIAARLALVTAYTALMTAATTAGTIAFALKTLVMSGAIAAWGTLNAVMKKNVIVFVISLIIGLITWLIALWQKNDAFAIGFLRAWYGILNFFDRLPAYFWQLAEWIYSPMLNLVKGMSSIFDAVIKGIIDGINSILGVINKVTGSKFEITTAFSTDEFIDNTLDFMKTQKADAYDRAAKNAEERNQSLKEFIKDRASDDVKKSTKKEDSIIDPNKLTAEWSKLSDGGANGGNMGSAPQTGFQSITPNIDRVGEVGKINDNVEISSEDLKTMRELAEMKNIQNFVSLQPTVSVQTGDINNGYDIDTIIGRIERSLNDEIASSAEGVYNR